MDGGKLDDELLELGLHPEDVPFRIVFATPSHDDDDLQALGLLTGKARVLIEGIIVGPKH